MKIAIANKFQYANLQNQRGVILYSQNKIEDAKQCFLKALNSLKEKDLKNEELIKCNLNLYLASKKLNQPEADNYKEEALKIKKEMKDSDVSNLE